MTSRQGFYVALMGLLIMLLCAAVGLSFPDLGTDTSGSGEPNLMATILIPIGFAGFIVTIVGFVMAGVASIVKGSDQSAPQEGLWMALIGLILGALCVSAAYAMPYDGRTAIVFLFYLGGPVGFMLMAIGLIMAGVGALTRKTR